MGVYLFLELSHSPGFRLVKLALHAVGHAFISSRYVICQVQSRLFITRFGYNAVSRMSPVRQSARQRARSAAHGHPPRMLDDEVTASPLIPTARFTTATATGVAQRQVAATDDSVAAMREMLQSVRPRTGV